MILYHCKRCSYIFERATHSLEMFIKFDLVNHLTFEHDLYLVGLDINTISEESVLEEFDAMSIV